MQNNPPTPLQSVSAAGQPALVRLNLISHSRQALEISEVAAALSWSENSVRNFLEAGLFVSCRKGVGRSRRHVTIERWSVEAWKLNELEAQGIDVSNIEQSGLVRMWRATLKSRLHRKAAL